MTRQGIAGGAQNYARPEGGNISRLTLCALVLATIGAGLPHATGAPGEMPDDDVLHPGCPGMLLVPHLAEPDPSWTTDRRSYDIVVLVAPSFVSHWDGVEAGGWRAAVDRFIAHANEIYDPLGIDITVIDAHEDQIQGPPEIYLRETVKHMTWYHPDVTYDATLLLVHEDIGSYGVANCIGGAGTTPLATAMVTSRAAPTEVGEYRFYDNRPGMVIAHELAHLLAAQHHHANCHESMGEPVDRPCTLMMPRLAGDVLSTLEAMVMRGWAEDHL